jgi:hypothetical protein
MDISVKTVSTNLMRAKAMIKEQLEKLESGTDSRYASGANLFVLSKVLKSQEAIHVPKSAINTVHTGLQEIIKGVALKSTAASGLNVASTIITKKLAVIIVASIITVTPISAVFVYEMGEFTSREVTQTYENQVVDEDTQDNVGMVDETETKTKTEDIVEDGDIEFVGGFSNDGHVNPTSAMLTNTNFEIALTEWEIINSDGAILFAGKGEDPAAAFGELIASSSSGIYTLKYSITDKGGNLIEKSREFEIE